MSAYARGSAGRFLVFLFAFAIAMPCAAVADDAEQLATERDAEKREGPSITSLASRLVQRGELTEARLMMETHLAKEPRDAAARAMLATIMIESGEYSASRRLFEELIEEHPDNVVLLNNYSWLLSTTTDTSFRDPARALVLAQQAVLIDSANYHVWSTLARAHYSNRNFEKACEALRHCIDLARAVEAPSDVLQKYQQEMAEYRDALQVMRLIE